MSLTDWVQQDWLHKHTTSAREIRDLLAVISRDLANSQLDELDPDWQLNIAYNAALQCATAALAACGYRAAREAQHYRVIQSLEYTIGADHQLVQQLDIFRRKRNLNAYERAGLASKQEARVMFELASKLKSELLAWLEREHPDLLGMPS